MPVQLRVFQAGAAVLAILLLGGCGERASATDAASSPGRRVDSGIAGRVVIGPTCPVQRIGQSCVRPYQATITIRREPKRRFVARVRSSSSGRFRVALAPGTYVLVPQSGRPFPRGSSRTVTIRSHRYTRLVISYDSGIR
jgi:hypothetical protein